MTTRRKLKKLIRDITPPVIWRVAKEMRGRQDAYGWSGNFRSWDEVKRLTTGYEAENILKKIKNALLKVKNGEAACERDSILLKKIGYPYPLLAGLMWIAAREDGVLNVIDFGGSLGSSYFQNKKFLGSLKEVKWNIVEQPKFVEYGKKFFEDAHLKFYYDIENCVKEQNPNAILLSSVLQYLEKPYEMVQKIIDFGFQYILFDRTMFAFDGKDRLTIQKVPPRIYSGSYPCWCLSEERFLKLFRSRYELVVDFEGTDRANVPSFFKGFVFKKREVEKIK